MCVCMYVAFLYAAPKDNHETCGTTVDGSFMEQSGEAGAAAVARDNNGNMIFTVWRFFKHRGIAPGIEALACFEGLRWAIHWGLSKIILESDCAWVAARINNHVVDRSEEGPVIEEVRSLSCLVRRRV